MRATASTELNTHHGMFQMTVFCDDTGLEHVALVRGVVDGVENVPVRVHSACLAADVFSATRCESGDQLDRFLEALGSMQEGVLLYLQQEGRGHGLTHAVRAYCLQAQGLDTVDADQALGEVADRRCYAGAAAMLKQLGVRSVVLYTDNADKMHQLQWNDVEVTQRRSLWTPVSRAAAGLRDVLQARNGHFTPKPVPVAAK